MKKHCDVHYSDPIEAEEVEWSGRPYIQLRCSQCGRKRGLRRPKLIENR